MTTKTKTKESFTVDICKVILFPLRSGMVDFASFNDVILKLLYMAGLFICVFFAGASLEYRKQRAVKIYLVLMALGGTWLFFNLMVLLAPTMELKEFFVRLRFISISLLPGFWLHFCIELFKKPYEKKMRVGLPIFFIIPAAVTLACFVPALNSLLVYDVKPMMAFGVETVKWRIGPLVQLIIAYSYGLLCLWVIASIRGVLREHARYRKYAFLMASSISLYVVIELIGFWLVPEVRFLGLPALAQIPASLFVYHILHRQQVVRTFSSTNDKIFESLPIPALLFNRDQQLYLYNSRAANLFSLNLSSVGRDLRSLVPPGLEGEAPGLEALHSSYVCEWTNSKNGSSRYFEVRAEMIDLEGLFGEIFILVSFVEVTDLKRSTVMNQRLMSILSHDLLGNLSGLVTLSNHRHPQYWELIAETARSSADLLKNILLWTSSTDGFYRCNKEICDLSELSQIAVHQSSSFLSVKSLRVQGSLLREPLIANVDEKMFSAIFRNLLSNAARFSPRDGVIELNGSLQGDFIEITVEDQGPGMESEMAEQVLAGEERPSKAGSSGYGIGLFLVRQFIRMHEGSMEVRSSASGGCCMKLIFPVVPDMGLTLPTPAPL